LAIELAAARGKTLSPEAIRARLDRRFALLTGGAQDWPPRHRTLHEAIEWSYDLLAPDEQALFRRLSIFAGGCTLEAAEAICGASLDRLTLLVDRSLVQADEHGGETRYRLLETLREFGGEKLRESGDEPDLRRRHRDWYLQLV